MMFDYNELWRETVHDFQGIEVKKVHEMTIHSCVDRSMKPPELEVDSIIRVLGNT